MSSLEMRQMLIRSDLETIICQASCVLDLMATDADGIGEVIQDSADTIRMLANQLMAKV